VPGRLTAEERAARLAEMSANASEHERHRTSRLTAADAADAAADGGANGAGGAPAAPVPGKRPGDSFLAAATAEVYGSLMASGTSLEARIGSRKHFQQR